MPTGRLGTSDSRLGNITLGSPGEGTIHEGAAAASASATSSAAPSVLYSGAATASATATSSADLTQPSEDGAFTGRLGISDSQLGRIVLGSSGEDISLHEGAAAASATATSSAAPSVLYSAAATASATATTSADLTPQGEIQEGAAAATASATSSVAPSLVFRGAATATATADGNAAATQEIDGQTSSRARAYSLSNPTLDLNPTPAPPAVAGDPRIQILYDGADITADCVLAQTRFVSRANGSVGEATVVIRDIERAYALPPGKTLELFIDGRREWDGWGVKRRYNYWTEGGEAIDEPRKLTLVGADRNVLFERRILHDKVDGATVPDNDWPTNTMDQEAILGTISQYLDPTDGIDYETFVEPVAAVDPYAPIRLPGPTVTFGRFLSAVARAVGAVYYINPDRQLVYTDVNEPDAPFTLTDHVTAVTTQVGVREFTITNDASNMVNDALIWGAGQGSSEVVFSRVQDGDSIAAHGLWQNKGGWRAGVWKQESADRIADSIVNGSPAGRRGRKDDAVTVTCALFEPGLRVAHKVPVNSSVHDYSDTVPVREMAVTFPTPRAIRYDLRLSHELDEPWSVVDPWIPPDRERDGEGCEVVSCEILGTPGSEEGGGLLGSWASGAGGGGAWVIDDNGHIADPDVVQGPNRMEHVLWGSAVMDLYAGGYAWLSGRTWPSDHWIYGEFTIDPLSEYDDPSSQNAAAIIMAATDTAIDDVEGAHRDFRFTWNNSTFPNDSIICSGGSAVAYSFVEGTRYSVLLHYAASSAFSAKIWVTSEGEGTATIATGLANTNPPQLALYLQHNLVPAGTPDVINGITWHGFVEAPDGAIPLGGINGGLHHDPGERVCYPIKTCGEVCVVPVFDHVSGTAADWANPVWAKRESTAFYLASNVYASGNLAYLKHEPTGILSGGFETYSGAMTSRTDYNPTAAEDVTVEFYIEEYGADSFFEVTIGGTRDNSDTWDGCINTTLTHHTAMLSLRDQLSNGSYTSARLQVRRANTAGGIPFQFSSANVDVTIVEQTRYRLRTRITGDTMQAKLWDAAVTEPVAWTVQVTGNSSHAVPGAIQLHLAPMSTQTNFSSPTTIQITSITANGASLGGPGALCYLYRATIPYQAGSTQVWRDGLRQRLGHEYEEDDPNLGTICFPEEPTGSLYMCFEGQGLAHPSAPPAGNGMFIEPVTGTISATFGPQGSSVWPSAAWHNQWYTHFHNGVDYAVPTGTSVFAAAAGTVVYETQAAGGTMIHVFHAGGLRTTYAHLSSRIAAEGSTVAQGDLLGLSGATGNVTGPHLHWGLVINGWPEDPLNYT